MKALHSMSTFCFFWSEALCGFEVLEVYDKLAPHCVLAHGLFSRESQQAKGQKTKNSD